MRHAYLTTHSGTGDTSLNVMDGMHAENQLAITTTKFDRLSLSYGDWPDLSFFQSVAHKIRKLDIHCYGAVNLKQVEFLTDLTELSIEAFEPTKLDRAFSFSHFPNLQRCELTWRRGFFGDIFDSDRLTHLKIHGYPSKDLLPLSKLKCLQRLELVQGSLVTLDGIEHLKQLKNFEVYHMRNLVSIEAAASAPCLGTLTVGKCSKLKDMAVFSDLAKRCGASVNSHQGIALTTVSLLFDSKLETQ